MVSSTLFFLLITCVLFFWMFVCHYVCYVLHVVDGVRPLLSLGQELPLYGQSGVVRATVSGMPSRDTGWCAKIVFDAM